MLQRQLGNLVVVTNQPSVLRADAAQPRMVPHAEAADLPAPSGRARSARHRDYTRRRARQIAYGRWQPWADAEPVRQHVLRLRRGGASYRDIARAAGVSPMTVHNLVNGCRARNSPMPSRIGSAQARQTPRRHAQRCSPSASPQRLRIAPQAPGAGRAWPLAGEPGCPTRHLASPGCAGFSTANPAPSPPGRTQRSASYTAAFGTCRPQNAPSKSRRSRSRPAARRRCLAGHRRWPSMTTRSTTLTTGPEVQCGKNCASLGMERSNPYRCYRLRGSGSRGGRQSDHRLYPVDDRHGASPLSDPGPKSPRSRIAHTSSAVPPDHGLDLHR